MDTTLPMLTGRVCLLAGAGSATGVRIHQSLLDIGACVLALYDRQDRGDTALRRAAGTIASVTELADSVAVAADLAWLLARTQRLDYAVICQPPDLATGCRLAELAAYQLGLTRQFDPTAPAALAYFAVPEPATADALRQTLASGPFADVRATVIDSWPDTPLSSLAAVIEMVADGLVRTAGR